MSEKIAVSQIEIKIGKDVLKLSLAQMQELKKILNETFPDEKTVYVNPVYFDRPYYVPNPIYITPPIPHPWNEWIPTCGDLTTTTFKIEASNIFLPKRLEFESLSLIDSEPDTYEAL